MSVFKSIQNNPGGLSVVPFMSYGSPVGGSRGLYDTKGKFRKTPMFIASSQRISLGPVDLEENGKIKPVGLPLNDSEAIDIVTENLALEGVLDLPNDLM
jgi:hypothetical protein